MSTKAEIIPLNLTGNSVREYENKLALEWLINQISTFIAGLDKGLYKNNIELEIIEPEGHYDGFKELGENNIQLQQMSHYIN